MAIDQTSSTETQTADGAAVRTVAAEPALLEAAAFSDKPTAITAGLRERSVTAWAAASGKARTGYWECGTGTFTGVREGSHEICYIVSGRATLRGAAGEVTEVSAGSILVLPDGWKGTWEIHEPVRKMFVVVPE